MIEFGPLDALARDPTVTDVAITCEGRVWADRGGGMTECRLPMPLRTPRIVREYAVRLCAQLGRRLDDACPIADASSEDGIRVHAVIAPLVAQGAAVTIRFPDRRLLGLTGLRDAGMFPPDWLTLLRNLVKNRARVLISGGTGSGKSTLVSLIPRLYDASTGSVCVMGADVRAWPLDQLRHVVATVPQRASLVSGTIRSNLAWRDEAATDEELWAALDMAQASEFVRNKPQGLDAPVEAGGKNFSGGQRQRLTIARALVGSPQILIMDDSASALDFKTDAALRHAIRARSVRGAAEGGLPLTTVIVSQRVSTVRDADMICVLDHGSVAGLGTHDGLYATCQLYREICQSQLRREELEGQQGSTAPTPAPTAPLRQLAQRRAAK